MKTTINKKLRGIAAALLLIGLVPSNMMAQDKVEASVGADLVSGYIWRGQDLGGVSIQPSLGISYKGLQHLGNGLLVQHSGTYQQVFQIWRSFNRSCI